MPATEESQAAERLRQEFNGWQARGKGASMGRHHAAIAELAMARMGLRDGERVLDLGCGSGWAARELAARVAPTGVVVGLDISDAMISEADAMADKPANLRFVCVAAEHIPAPDASFTRVLSVESIYYYPDPRAVLDELRRVVAPGGRIFLLMCLYRGHPFAEQWRAALKVPVHLLRPEEWVAMLRIAGWSEVASETFAPDPAEAKPDEHAWALLLSATRP